MKQNEEYENEINPIPQFVHKETVPKNQKVAEKEQLGLYDIIIVFSRHIECVIGIQKI
ncbi:hypothetical protein [Tissierella praeacuta]|uniref:hypothetical protein n=1 Tax=Tissierella praeacuta TaxID=43131 RepID=UPI00333E71B8